MVATVPNVPNPVFLTYDSANGNIYAANHDTQFVSVIDSSTNSVTKTITVGPDPTGVGFDADNGIIYVGNQGANYVSLINGLNNQVIGTVTVGSGPVTPVYDPVQGAWEYRLCDFYLFYYASFSPKHYNYFSYRWEWKFSTKWWFNSFNIYYVSSFSYSRQ